MKTELKTLCTMLLLATILWTPPLSAKYCKKNSAGKPTSCRFTDNTGRPHDATISISYTQQGWSLMLAFYIKDWLMLEGDAKIKMGDSEIQTIPYVTTRKDITSTEELIEAVVYRPSEELLWELDESSGMIKFWLPSSEGEELEVKFRAMRFKNLDKFIAETKETLGL
jgi:hypothetical protein